MTQRMTTAKDIVLAFPKYGSLQKIAKATKTPYITVNRLYQEAVAEGLMDKLPRGAKTGEHVTNFIKGKLVVKKARIGGKRRAKKAKPLELKDSGVTRFIFTCAQNNTYIHQKFFDNLLLFKEHYKAELHISRFSYQKRRHAEMDKKAWLEAQTNDIDKSGKEAFWYDEGLKPYFSDDQRNVAPGLVWRGDANIIPTMVNPLAGKGGMTGRKSGIFPHVTIALESVPSMEHEAVKFLYTTGTVTLRNYIQRDAGFKADFHHTYGALLVEVYEGNWWCRQINADSEGNFQDLDVVVKNGELTTGNPIDTLVTGDTHRANIDPVVMKTIWGKGGMLDYLHPKRQVKHDIFDMYSRNHHDIDDPHQMFLRLVKKQDNVRGEVVEVADFLDYTSRDWCETIVANSNHDNALLTWLKNRKAMHDPVNFQFWSELNNRVLNYTMANKDFPIILREAYLAVTGKTQPPKNIRFLARDESYIVCPDKGGGIEVGAHGNDGANGARGTTAGFTKIGRRITKGHDHTAAIKQNVHSVGTCRKLRTDTADYTHGPSSWSHSQGVIYPSAKRAIITIWKGMPWAPR
jgi:hypothetical protein